MLSRPRPYPIPSVARQFRGAVYVQRAGGHDDLVLSLQRGDAGVRGGFVEKDSHERRGIDRDHPGRPSAS